MAASAPFSPPVIRKVGGLLNLTPHDVSIVSIARRGGNPIGIETLVFPCIGEDLRLVEKKIVYCESLYFLRESDGAIVAVPVVKRPEYRPIDLVALKAMLVERNAFGLVVSHIVAVHLRESGAMTGALKGYKLYAPNAGSDAKSGSLRDDKGRIVGVQSVIDQLS